MLVNLMMLLVAHALATLAGATTGTIGPTVTSGPRVLWANVHEMQHAVLTGR